MYTLTLARTKESAVEVAAELICTRLAEAIDMRGMASLVVSGGTSPIPLFERLNIALLPWHKITVTLADERWVDNHHENSNERLIHAHLLKNRAESACFIPLKNESTTPKQGARLTEQALTVLPNALDVVVLGMGMDGHTLSWFPDSTQLAAVMNPAGRARCGEVISPSAVHPRLTLTYSWIVKARDLVLFLSNEEKTRRFKDLCKEEAKLPVDRLALDQHSTMSVIGVDRNAVA